jgi:hypothetical protein
MPAGDMLPLGLLSMACFSNEHHVPESPAYRKGASHGLTLGSMTTPAVIASLMLREASSTGKRDVLLAFYLRMAVSMSSVNLVDAIRRPVQRTREGAAWMWPFGALLLLSLLVHANFMGIPFMVIAVIMGAALALFRGMIRNSGRAFTLGEATSISTGISLLAVDTAAQVLAVATGKANPLVRAMLPVDAVVQCLVVGTFITLLVLWPFVKPRSPPALTAAAAAASSKGQGGTGATKASDEDGGNDKDKKGDGSSRGFRFVSVLSCVVGFVCMPAATLLLGQHLAAWVAGHVTGGDSSRQLLLAYWGGTLALTLLQFPKGRGSLPRIIVRKGFHIVAVLLFAPGQLIQPGWEIFLRRALLDCPSFPDRLRKRVSQRR